METPFAAPFTTARPSPGHFPVAYTSATRYTSVATIGGAPILRTHWQYSAKGAVDYLSKADYYAASPGDLLGRGFDHLDIGTMLPRDVMECLCHNLDPATGHLLRPHAKDGDRVGMDFTFNAPKSVTLARELGGPGNEGDPRVEAAHREAVAYAMEHVEADMKTRVRGGRDPDRVTGNLCAYRVTHRDTRVNPDDRMPDPHLHDHVFVMNLTFDRAEKRFKAVQLADIKHDANWYEAIYHNRLAGNLRALGYGVRRDGRAFEVAGIDRPLIDKFSRRTRQIEATAAKLGIRKAESKAKLGATTRLGKTTETVDDLRSYYVSRLTHEERERLSHLEFQPSFVSSDEKAVAFAVGHVFERKSVEEEKKLYETALRHGVGSVTVEGLQAEAVRQGALLKDGQVTTRAVLAEEARVIDFAREGHGTMRPLVAGWGKNPPDATPLHPQRLDSATPAGLGQTEPHIPTGMTRLYHGAAAPEPITESRWFSSDRRYAEGYAEKSGGKDGVVFFVDLPTDHPLIEPEYPEQSIARGFHRNLTLPESLSKQAKTLAGQQKGRPDESKRPECEAANANNTAHTSSPRASGK